MEKALIILRGLPGSGKTTLANNLSEQGKYPVFSIDDYFTNAVTGEYTFKFDENHLAYKQCEKKCAEAMQTGVSKIILHNVFSMEWEIEPYFKLAQQHGYITHVVTVENYHNGTNKHAITPEQLQKMANKYNVKLL